jgi:CheY-like chemotaxis protein
VRQPINQDAPVNSLQGAGSELRRVERMPATRRPLYVLVVDDIPANQTVIRTLLQKRGHDVQVAGDGREAVDLHKRSTFDVLLMDVQMPTMDGLQATAAIRNMDDPGRSRVPIIALTSHAQADDRVRCLQAGMDDYLAKPVAAERLIELVERLGRVGAGPPAISQATPGTSSKGDRAIDIGATLSRLGNDPELLRDTAYFLVEDAPGLIARLRDGLQAGDVEAVERAAHTLKGMAANFDARAAMQAAARIEDLAKASCLDAADDAVAPLEREFERVIAALRDEVLGPNA